MGDSTDDKVGAALKITWGLKLGEQVADDAGNLVSGARKLDFPHHQNSMRPWPEFQTPVTTTSFRLPKLTVNGFCVTLVPYFSSMA